MSSRNKKKSSNQSTTISKDVRVMVKFGWNGARIPIPPNCKITTRSTLMKVVESIQTSVPSVIFEGFGMELDNADTTKEPTLLHMRNCVERSQWNNMKLEDVGVEGGGSALLTLNLGGVVAPNMNLSKRPNTSPVADDAKMPAVSSMNTAKPMGAAIPQPSPPTTSRDSSVNNTNPNEVQLQPQPQPQPQIKKPLTCEEALNKLITSHFDADSKDCIKTLIKVVDNIIHKPGETKTRSIRLQNAAFWKKVGSKKGGVEFLLACGFTPNTPVLSPTTNQNITLELKPENESSSKLFSARQLLHKFALNLGISSDDIAPLRKPTPLPQFNSTSSSSSNKSFDPFKPHSFNIQAASVGAPNPNGITPDGSANMSQTERDLQKLNQKAKQIELDMKKKPLDREWRAYAPGEQSRQQQYQGQILNANVVESAGKSKGDGALIAQRMKRMEEERKKREEGGFTTKAMRDLEKMKKAKLFTHAQLRICFPDGISITGNFYPNEKIETVQNLVLQHGLISNNMSFDLYITPPRRILPPQKTLTEEGLLPAARVFVSWKKGCTPPVGTPYVKPELFDVSTISSFPDSKNVVDNMNKKGSDEKSAKKKKSNEAHSGKRMSEEELMSRMMGKGNLLGKKKSSGGGTKGSSKGGMKPSWFKK